MDSGCFDEVMVSTDSEEYKNVATKYGASVPFLRGEETSGDSSSSRSVILEALDFYKQQGREFDCVCILQPTSPLRTGEDIKRAFLVKQANTASAIISVCELEYPKHIVDTLSSDLSFDGFNESEEEPDNNNI